MHSPFQMENKRQNKGPHYVCFLNIFQLVGQNDFVFLVTKKK